MGHVNGRWHLRHEVDATLRMGLGWGMLTCAGAYVMKLMLRWGWGWGGVVSWHGSDTPACVYEHLTHLLTHLWKQR